MAASIITIRNLVKKYGAITAIKGIDLDIKEGEIFALLGPNGAGKTTLFAILATLRTQSGGTARVLGLDVKTQREAIRRQIGIVFQEPALDDKLSALDNLMIMALFYGYSRSEGKKRAAEVLESLGMSELRDRVPKKMSGGQKRKLELARAIIAEPRLLFLDEATLGLDVDARRNFWQQVIRLNKKGSTIFLTTHYMEEAEIADRIALIDEGNIVALDSPENLKADVGGGLIRLDTENNGEALQWLRRHDMQADPSDEGLLISTDDPATVLPRLLTDLPYSVKRVEIRQPSLEDAFLTLTGRSLSSGETDLKLETKGAPS